MDENKEVLEKSVLIKILETKTMDITFFLIPGGLMYRYLDDQIFIKRVNKITGQITGMTVYFRKETDKLNKLIHKLAKVYGYRDIPLNFKEKNRELAEKIRFFSDSEN